MCNLSEGASEFEKMNVVRELKNVNKQLSAIVKKVDELLFEINSTAQRLWILEDEVEEIIDGKD